MDGNYLGSGVPVVDVLVGLGGISVFLGHICSPVFGLSVFL